MRLDCLHTTPGEVVHQLSKVLQSEEHFEKVMAGVRQSKIARDLGQNRRSLEGLGRPRLEVDTWAFHYWGQRLGYKCWKDPQFLREFERDNPACRVKAKGTREIQVGYGTGCAGGRAPKFRKSYG